MEIINFVPGATTAGDDIDIPTGAPAIDAVVAAAIIRLPKALADHPGLAIATCLDDHAAAQIVGALNPHAAADVVAAVADHTGLQWAAAFDVHAPADVVARITDHAVHAHNLVVGGGAMVEAFGATGAGVANLVSATGQTILGAGATGIQNIAAPQAHVGAGGVLAHAPTLVDVPHDAGVDAMPHTGLAVAAHGATVDVPHAGGNPVVAVATVTKVDADTVRLSEDTVLGDILVLTYVEAGARVMV